jgi:hypothetical protein
MDRKNLETRCKTLHGEKVGKRLFDAMMEIANKDFCVATAWNDHQVSIAKTCAYRGNIFEFTPNYDSLVLTDEEIIPLTELTYHKVSKHLPDKSYGHRKHCESDLPKN